MRQPPLSTCLRRIRFLVPSTLYCIQVRKSGQAGLGVRAGTRTGRASYLYGQGAIPVPHVAEEGRVCTAKEKSTWLSSPGALQEVSILSKTEITLLAAAGTSKQAPEFNHVVARNAG